MTSIPVAWTRGKEPETAQKKNLGDRAGGVFFLEKFFKRAELWESPDAGGRGRIPVFPTE